MEFTVDIPDSAKSRAERIEAGVQGFFATYGQIAVWDAEHDAPVSLTAVDIEGVEPKLWSARLVNAATFEPVTRLESADDPWHPTCGAGCRYGWGRRRNPRSRRFWPFCRMHPARVDREVTDWVVTNPYQHPDGWMMMPDGSVLIVVADPDAATPTRTDPDTGITWRRPTRWFIFRCWREYIGAGPRLNRIIGRTVKRGLTVNLPEQMVGPFTDVEEALGAALSWQAEARLDRCERDPQVTAMEPDDLAAIAEARAWRMSQNEPADA